MKRPSTWAAIVGGLLIAGFGYGLAQHVTNPTNLFWVNVAITVTNIAWIAFGIFLIVLFFKRRHQEDIAGVVARPVPDSQEDIEKLVVKNGWIIAFVLVLETIGSMEPWILNNYARGLTLLNIAVIFDVLVHIFFLYIIVQLFREKRGVLQLLLYVSGTYAAGWFVISLLRGHWVGAFMAVVLGFYFFYAIKARPSRRNYRIAHFVVLPAYIILLSIYPFFDNGDIPELSKKAAFLEQQFSDEAATLNGAYLLFLQREVPSRGEIDAVRNAIVKRDEKIREIFLVVDQLQKEYEKRLPSVAQKKSIEGLKYFLRLMEAHRAQAQKVTELMDYAEKVDFRKMTDKQVNDIRALIDDVQAFNSKFTEIQFERLNSNIDR